MPLTMVAILGLLIQGTPVGACDAEKAIHEAKREAERRLVSRKPLVAFSVLGPISWGQLVAAFPEYRELELPREKAAGRLVFVVGVTPRKESPAKVTPAPSPPVVVVGGGFEVWIDAETCRVLAVLEGA